MDSAHKLNALRQCMQQHDIDYYYVPSADAHNNEYVPPTWQRRSWLTNFTGSAGDAFIGLDQAYLWTDARYFLQAEQQLDLSVFSLMKQQQGMAPPIISWLADHAKQKRIGVDPRMMNCAAAKKWQEVLHENGSELVSIEENLIDTIWKDQPILKSKTISLWPEEHAGRTTLEKISILRDALKTDAHVITMLDAIAWLLNIRGQDIQFNPLVISYLIVTQDTVTLFVDEKKLDAHTKAYFSKYHINIQPYDNFKEYLNTLTGSVLLEGNTASWWVQQELKNATPVIGKSPITLMKAIKNKTEQDGMHEAHRKDALALCQLLCSLEKNWRGETELSVSKMALDYRAQQPDFKGLSFETISSYADHGAIIHYAVSEKTNVDVGDQSLYLLDSGGQYLQGTTDITRTFHLGTPTEEQKKHYTLVLKGHLGLRHTVFPKGTTGEQIDMIAHRALWQHGLDYGHGTGHGVGCFLCVHEGPQRISRAASGVALEAGMVVSNEPGLYFAGKYGIRIENLLLIKEVFDGEYLAFEDLTKVPYAHQLIDTNLLSKDEILAINNYHQEVHDLLCKDLPNETAAWLKDATKPLPR